MRSIHYISPAIFAALAYARTDLVGCTSTDVSSPAGASVAWYVPGTGELCEFLDCGGGRAPPKTTVPGCALYVGTETYKPSFLAGFGAAMTVGIVGAAGVEASATYVAASTSSVAAAVPTTATAGDADDDETETWASEAASTTTSAMSAAITGLSSSDQGSTTTWSSVETDSTTSVDQDLTAPSTYSTATSAATKSTASFTTSTKDIPTLFSASNTSSVATGSLSMSRSWVKSIPTFARGAADDVDRAKLSASSSKTKSASASLATSTGRAGKIVAVGGSGIFAAVVGVLAAI
ncbi:unnamed protein product [Aureobasidium uvarum]|uniref:Siderophore biosynthesis n=1 Tax=Aureobasidium uvarum TaxID=2773716 RepID=A0A9N8KR45_9PEZI|nr:unnamed protein product [Aureobasidium uvarum]